MSRIEHKHAVGNDLETKFKYKTKNLVFQYVQYKLWALSHISCHSLQFKKNQK